MFKADLLYADEEYIYKKPKIISENVTEDLKISKIFDFCAPLGPEQIKRDDIKHTLEELRNPCRLAKDVIFRQEIFKIFMRPGNLVGDLYTVLEDINVLLKIKETYDFEYGGAKDMEYLKAVNYLFFLKSYKLFLDNIHSALGGIEEDAKRDALRGGGAAQNGLHKFFIQVNSFGNEYICVEFQRIVGAHCRRIFGFCGRAGNDDLVNKCGVAHTMIPKHIVNSLFQGIIAMFAGLKRFLQFFQLGGQVAILSFYQRNRENKKRQ